MAVQYEFQATLSNGSRVDCLLKLPSPIGNLAIDSKFPMMDDIDDASTTDPQRKKIMAASLDKHISDISKKYIIAGETADCAILFLPSESLFIEIVQHHPHIVQQANRQAVWLACPTTLHAVLTTLQGVVRGMTLHHQTRDVFALFEKSSNDIRLFLEKFENAEKSVVKAKRELASMHGSYEKIRKSKEKLDRMLSGGGLDTTTTLGVNNDNPTTTDANGVENNSEVLVTATNEHGNGNEDPVGPHEKG